MCEDFKCVHQDYGFCNYDGEACEGFLCGLYGSCSECADNYVCEMEEQP